jgi:hypothetical protein
VRIPRSAAADAPRRGADRGARQRLMGLVVVPIAALGGGG